MASILIAEDEARIAGFVEKGLRAAGYATQIAPTGTEALHLAQTDEFDLLVLDVNLPGMNGFEVLEQLRGSGSRMPIIMLTARVELQDTVAGLEGGADDYLGKPFRFDELLARIRLRMRKDDDAAGSASLAHRDLALDIRTREARVAGARVELSAREFALAEEFVRNAGQVLSREQLLSRVWGYDFDPGSNVADVYVGYLRQKLGSDRIETVRGVGYRLT
ncbi:response regulator transcription factor [Microbacterium sp. EYE_5]|uniref:response regulator transcription factor n=1 Tax=unclassified Microbacterium TaxID=2609290 RepID=UPI0020049286|nr:MULTISPECIES: response regulator transcription factor [unclassified Microbacterium]MCK6080114.1 response regulator transcription factor [Microbacterium sp. EYE_382]MCK6085385.1 response regulator transcription factor [Microbacterium sp. EYE_384]MCK6122390.1 response regulator transcription factor [Microbacterium sp. EYE_80]MCK6126148.1 response regulator transcription factor [Microbacterium sp. EYE_79]MCK6141069.1 response regulator transcription factor [Microbacterium sp. EYE_39]